MTQIVPFESAKLPAYLNPEAAKALASELTANVGGGGFAVMSIKGKTFTVVKGGEREMVMNPSDQDEPATSINVVLLKANAGLSKVWYAKGYVDGSDGKPDCFSHDGTAPDSSVESPQSKKCAACPKNQWGSKIDESGKKLKACSDSRRVAIANVDDMEAPMLLRVPPASLKPLADYGTTLAKRNVPYNAVLTKLGFDREAATPKLTFKALSFLSQEEFDQVQDVVGSDVIKSILGQPGEAPVDIADDDSVSELKGSAPKAKAAPAEEEAPKPKPKVKAAPAEDEVEEAPKPKAKAKPAVSEDEVAEVVEAKPAAKPKAKVVENSLESELDDVLGELDD